MELDSLTLTSPLVAERNIFSITEISLLLKKCVESNFNNLCLRGEISGLKKHTSGHSYLALKDQDSVMDAVCWRGTKLALQLEDGLEIIASGRLTTYPGRSKYQLILESAEAAGQGALLKLLHERKIHLEAEGLFQRKRPLPTFPKKIGIITSATGAVIKDILHRIADRYPCPILVWPVAVQGLGAAEQIAKAIEGFGNLPLEDQPDVLIVARGGGSLEDLWAFNEEIVVRATANSKIPLISAVGHETDTTLIDFAADLRAPTPTAAAELATPVLRNILEGLAFLKTRLTALIKNKLQNHIIHLSGLRRGLPTPQRLIETAWLRFDDWCERFAITQSAFIDNKFRSLQHLSAQIKHPHFSIAFAEQKLNQNSQQLYILQKRFLEKLSERLKLVRVYLEQNSYQKILEKGFCWVENDNMLIRSAADFNQSISSTFNLNFKDGKVKVETRILEKKF